MSPHAVMVQANYTTLGQEQPLNAPFKVQQQDRAEQASCYEKVPEAAVSQGLSLRWEVLWSRGGRQPR